MGVPAFFRWVSEKYPKIVQECVEEEANVFSDGSEMPIDATQPNPNGIEFDNLYLDMNGIIHPCTHPEDGKEPPTLEHMFDAIGKHIERLFLLVRPRKLLYMAIDGIAPRAKMNQQRSRRFRAALEAEELKADQEKARKSARSKGLRVPDEEDGSKFDSNVITPGTMFMDKLAEYLRYFIIEKQSTDAAWGQCKVILSDAQSPGEGEHKIMQFVRRQRAEQGHDPNTRHVMYGLDADLIMLGLASHEVHFTVLRDKVFFGKQNRRAGAKVDQVLQPSAGAAEDEDNPKSSTGTGALSISKLKPIEMLHVWVLREYLEHEFRAESFEGGLRFTYDFERCIDDFVFLCFFVGNDFLPHLPSLSIREGGLELLINLYRKVLPTLDGFLTEDGDLHLGRVGEMMRVLGAVEDRIFLMRKAAEERDKARKKMIKQAQSGGRQSGGQAEETDDGNGLVRYGAKVGRKRPTATVDVTTLAPTNFDPAKIVPLVPVKRFQVDAQEESEAHEPRVTAPPSKSENKSAAALLRAKLMGSSASSGDSAVPSVQQSSVSTSPEGLSEEDKPALSEANKSQVGAQEEETAMVEVEADEKVKNEEKSVEFDEEGEDEDDEEDEEEDPLAGMSYEERLKHLRDKRNAVDEADTEDAIKLGEMGWRDRYYEIKFGKEFAGDVTKRRQVVESYVRGLAWVLQYYYKGCQSWKWYYEFHYAPFASDLVDLESISLDWAPSRPFKPFEQLMAVLPSQSAHALPEPCRYYMTDPDSPIADFYPREIQFDPNGKPVRWLWIALLPFIDESRLLEHTKHIEDKFNTDEKRRNAMMPDLIFVPKLSPGAQEIQNVLGKSPPNLLSNWESDQVALLKSRDKSSSMFGDALDLPAPTTAGDARGGGQDDIFLSAAVAGGISGYFLPAAPEFAVRVGQRVKTAFPAILHSVESSATFVCEFRLPPMLPHLSRLCNGVVIPPRILNAEDLQLKRPRLSNMDVSVLLSNNNGNGNNSSGNVYSQSGLGDRSWGSAEPTNKFQYSQNPFLAAPPPLLGGSRSQQQQYPPPLLSSAGQPPSTYGGQSYYGAYQPPAAPVGGSSMLAQLQETLRNYTPSGQQPPHRPAQQQSQYGGYQQGYQQGGYGGGGYPQGYEQQQHYGGYGQQYGNQGYHNDGYPPSSSTSSNSNYNGNGGYQHGYSDQQQRQGYRGSSSSGNSGYHSGARGGGSGGSYGRGGGGSSYRGGGGDRR